MSISAKHIRRKIIAKAKPVTKFSYCINSVEEIPQIMDIAYYFANNNKKGSVHIDLPKCVADNTFKGFLYKF